MLERAPFLWLVLLAGCGLTLDYDPVLRDAGRELDAPGMDGPRGRRDAGLDSGRPDGGSMGMRDGRVPPADATARDAVVSVDGSVGMSDASPLDGWATSCVAIASLECVNTVGGETVSCLCATGTCNFACGSSSCLVICAAGTSCVASCPTHDCQFICEAGASCTFNCGTSSCTVPTMGVATTFDCTTGECVPGCP